MSRKLMVLAGGAGLALMGFGSYCLYSVDSELVKLVQSATTESGETDTAKWMTGVENENR